MRNIDYKRLLDSFWEKRLFCPLTSCEADMYYYLLRQCSLSNWANTFKLPTKKCELELDFTRKTICNVRNSLQQKGYIKFIPSRVRGEVAEYQIVDIDAFTTETQKETQKETQEKEKEKEKEKFPPAPPIKEKEKEKEKCLNRQLSSDELVLTQERAKKKPSSKEYSICHKGRIAFESYYLELYGEPYYWQAKDAKAMNSLLRKISYSRTHRTDPLPVDDDNLLNALVAFLHRIDKSWIMDNFSVNKIDSQYNEIISEIRNNRIKNKYNENNTGWKAPEHSDPSAYRKGFGTTNRK